MGERGGDDGGYLLKHWFQGQKAGRGLFYSSSLISSLSAACYFLKSEGCIIYYLEKFYQREVALRNIIFSIQKVHHKKDQGQGQAMRWICHCCTLRREKHIGCHLSAESILNNISALVPTPLTQRMKELEYLNSLQ